MRVGIDLGGTKIEIAVLSDDGEELMRERCASPRGDYLACLDAIANLVEVAKRRFFRAQALDKIGIAIPGAVSRKTGRIKNANSTWLIGEDLQDDLSQRLACQVTVANDANCFVLSEASDGAASAAECVFGVIIGTGTGAGIFVNGGLLIGANAIAGEWGHNPLPWPQANEQPGPLCYCGKYGCLETWLSGPGFAASFYRQSGRKLSAQAIAELAERGDQEAMICLEQYEDRLARGLASVINILDPDVIVLGGGMSNIARLYQQVPRLWSAYVFSDQVDTRLVAPRFGDSSGVRGAARL